MFMYDYPSIPHFYIVDEHGNVHDKSSSKLCAESEAQRLTDDPTVPGVWHVISYGKRFGRN